MFDGIITRAAWLRSRIYIFDWSRQNYKRRLRQYYCCNFMLRSPLFAKLIVMAFASLLFLFHSYTYALVNLQESVELDWAQGGFRVIGFGAMLEGSNGAARAEHFIKEAREGRFDFNDINGIKEKNIYKIGKRIPLKTINQGRIVVEVVSDSESAIATIDSKYSEVTYMLDREFAGGVGTEEDPFLIANARQLDNVRNHLDKHFKQVADIDLCDNRDGAGWDPLGAYYSKDSDDNMPFLGVFDGNGYAISNLFINRTDKIGVGLFAYLETNALLTNITLLNFDVKGDSAVGGLVGTSSGEVSNSYLHGLVSGIGSNVGGLVGQNVNGTIESCSLEIHVFGRERIVGGLAGLNLEGIINNCSAKGSVIGTNDIVGGLVGYNVGAIKNSNATVNVTGLENGTGGLIGANEGLIVKGSYAQGNVEGKDYVGGLIGWSQGLIKQCYAEGDVKGQDNVGGLVGYVYQDSVISECFTHCNVIGNEFVGGLIGCTMGGSSSVSTVEYSYSIGAVTGSKTDNVGGLMGFVGYVNVNSCYSANCIIIANGDEAQGFIGGSKRASFTVFEVSYSYFDQEKVNKLSILNYKSAPKTTNEMKQQSTYEQWDFIFQWGIEEDSNEGYPYLQWPLRK